MISFLLASASISDRIQAELSRQDSPPKTITKLCPVNHLEIRGQAPVHVTFAVKIPENWTLIPGNPDNFYEFIPKGQSPDHWSEIISIHMIVGLRLSASHFFQMIYGGLQHSTANFREWSRKVTNKTLYNGEEGVLSYINNTNHEQQECIGIRAFSGPMDCCCIQYTKVLQEGQSLESLQKEVTDMVNQLGTLIIARNVRGEWVPMEDQ